MADYKIADLLVGRYNPDFKAVVVGFNSEGLVRISLRLLDAQRYMEHTEREIDLLYAVVPSEV